MRLRCLFLLVIVSIPLLAAEPTTEKPGSARDFIQTPPLPVTDLNGPIMIGQGILQIHYRNGRITQVNLQTSSGFPQLDNAAVRHVKETFKLRPGTSGVVKLPFGDPGDFTSTPNMTIPYSLHTRLGHVHIMSSLEINYRDGKITAVKVVQSSGNELLDHAIVTHIQKHFAVRSGRSGKALLPVHLHL